MEEFELLGPAEKHIAKQVGDAVNGARDAAYHLIHALEGIDSESVEPLMLTNNRDAIISLLEPLQQMSTTLILMSLPPSMLGAIVKNNA